MKRKKIKFLCFKNNLIFSILVNMDVKNNKILVARVEDEENDEENNDEKRDEKDDKDIDFLIEYIKEENGEIKVEKTETLTKETQKTEKVTYIGHVEDNKNFEEEPSVPDGALKIILNGYAKKKTNIYEVIKIFKRRKFKFKT